MWENYTKDPINNFTHFVFAISYCWKNIFVKNLNIPKKLFKIPFHIFNYYASMLLSFDIAKN